MKASPASSLPRGKGGFNFAYFSCLRWLVFLCFFFLLFEFLLPSELRKVFNLLFTYLSWVPRHLLRKVLLALSSLKMKRGLISFMASTSLKGEGELDLFYDLNIARRRGRLILSVLGVHARWETRWTWVRIVLSVSKHLGQSHTSGAHARGEAYYNSAVSSTGCLNT